jgi:hypothetical protein
MKTNNNNHLTTRLLDYSTTRLLDIVLLGVIFLLVVAGCSSNINMVKKDEPVPVPKEKISLPPTGSIWPGENAISLQ